MDKVPVRFFMPAEPSEILPEADLSFLPPTGYKLFLNGQEYNVTGGRLNYETHIAKGQQRETWVVEVERVV